MAETTVIIPNYNGKKYLEPCLTSLFSCEQSGQDGEAPFLVTVVDNGSDDGSVEYIRVHFPQVKLICFAENKGFCAAVNAGILASDTPFVLLLNNDTTVEDRFVSFMTEAISENAGFFSVGAKMVSMQEPDRVDTAGDFYCALGWAFARGKGKPASHYMQPCDVFSACAGAAIYRKDILEQIGLFDETHFAYLEDMDLGYRARLYGYRNRFEPRAVVHHAGSAFSGSRYNAFKVRLSSRNSVYLIGKNMPPLQILLNLPFLVMGFGIKYLFFLRKGFGGIYAKGLWKGLKLACSEQGRAKHVPFAWHRLPRYVRVEWELLYNIIRRVMG